MATLETIQLVLHTIQNMESMRVHIRNNAQGYVIDVQSGRLTSAKVVELMLEDANEYLRRLQLQKTIIDTPNKKAKLLAGLAQMGITEAEITSAYVEMKTSADTTISATLTTQTEIEARAAAILSEVAEHDTVW